MMVSLYLSKRWAYCVFLLPYLSLSTYTYYKKISVLSMCEYVCVLIVSNAGRRDDQNMDRPKKIILGKFLNILKR